MERGHRHTSDIVLLQRGLLSGPRNEAKREKKTFAKLLAVLGENNPHQGARLFVKIETSYSLQRQCGSETGKRTPVALTLEAEGYTRLASFVTPAD